MTATPSDLTLDLTSVTQTMARGGMTSVELTQACLDRIARHDSRLRAVLAIDPTALDQAAAADRRRSAGPVGPLNGIPVLLKDNIDTSGLASTSGSRLLAALAPPRCDADVVARLRRCGAVVLGKTNLSEWCNFRSTRASEGWSAVGGQTRNPYSLERSPWGSSSGSAVAIAAGMAPLSLGTETDGSVVGPAGVNGVVGLKPQFGLLPLRGVAPISAQLDTIGLFGHRVADVALALDALLGRAPTASTIPRPVRVARLGLWMPSGTPAATAASIMDVRERLKQAGAEVIDVDVRPSQQLVLQGLLAMYAEFASSLEDYLVDRPGAPSTISDLIRANETDAEELAVFGQDLLEWVAEMTAAELAEGATGREPVRAEARELIQDALTHNRLDAVIAPTNEPAWPIDHASGDGDRLATSTPSALAGYPCISIPVGLTDGLPVGLSIFGPDTVSGLLPIAASVESECGHLTNPNLPPREDELR